MLKEASQMGTNNYNVNFLVINDNDTINKINEYIKNFNFKINLFSASTDVEVQDIISKHDLDYVFAPESVSDGESVERIYSLLHQYHHPDCIIILQHHNKPMLEHLHKSNVLIVDDLSFDLFKKLVGYSIVNKDEFIFDTDSIQNIYKDNFVTTHDALTMLPNRLFLLNKIESSIIEAKITKNIMPLFFIDLDGFKNINDKAGHKTGDIILKEVSRRLTKNTRISDVVSRHGGDEFIVFLPHIRSKKDAEIVANKILSTLSEPFYVNNETWNITASIGIAIYPDDSITAEKLIEYADEAMYAAKDSGKNTFRYFNKEISAELEKKYCVLEEIRHAIVNDHFDVVLQPQHDLASGEIVSVELFIRWMHPEKGIVMPKDFLPYILNTGYINSLGDLVVKKALGLYYELKRICNKKINIAVNTEARQFINDSFIEHVSGLKRLGVNVSMLTVEITEDCYKTNFEIMKEKLNKLKDLGVTICLDDFGMGNSSISQLVQLPVDIIKIDNKHLYNNRDNKVVQKSIIALAHSLGIKVMAKRIDDEVQLKGLQELGCDYGQGYCYERPLALDAFTQYIKSRAKV